MVNTNIIQYSLVSLLRNISRFDGIWRVRDKETEPHVRPRILIVDDHPLTAAAVATRLRQTMPSVVVEIADSIGAATQQAPRIRNLSVILLDLMLPDAKGFSGLLLMRLAAPSTPVAILSARQDCATIARARALGAAGFVPKSIAAAELVEAVRQIMFGGVFFPKTDQAADGAELDAAGVGEKLDKLSAAQLRVLLACADGRPNKQVAGDLNLTEATVKAHMTAILRKLEVDDRVEAAQLIRPILGDVLRAA